jgi:AcrR family transcriptional regulator
MGTKSRKMPRQSRSKATVDALLQATAHILLEGGIEALTTNHVAEVAGVSIGSLYQYFPNKGSILAALIEKHVEHEVKVLTKVFEDWQGGAGEPLIRMAIKEFIQIQLDDLTLASLLYGQVSYLECRDALRQATKFFEGIMADLLNTHFNGQVTPKVIAIKAFVVTNAIDSLVQLALVENSALLSDPDFLDELVSMVMQTFSTK